MSRSEPRPGVRPDGYQPPEVCDVDIADDREFVVVPGAAPVSEPIRN